MDSLYVVVRLTDNGDAKVTARSHVKADQESSECFIPLTVPDGCKVNDYHVSRENENYYLKNSPNWDTRWSRYDKLNKCAIEKTGENNYIMHWGLAENGYRVFYISYTITNLLRRFSDADGFLHEFISPGVYPLPRFAEVIVYGDHDVMFTTENTRLRSSGFKGKTLVSENHNILAFTLKPFDKDSHITIAARIKQGLFNPELVTEASFADYMSDWNEQLIQSELQNADSKNSNTDKSISSKTKKDSDNKFLAVAAVAVTLCLLLVALPVIAYLVIKRKRRV